MKTAEEILQSYWEKIIDGELYISKVDALKAMKIYAEQQVKNLNIPDVSNRRKLLLDFMTYVTPEAYATHSKAELADNYLSSNSC